MAMDLNREQKRTLKKMGALDEHGNPARQARTPGAKDDRSGRIQSRCAKADACLALVHEVFGHLLLEMARPDCRSPSGLPAGEVAPSQAGREMIAGELADYGDARTRRTVRVRFSG